MIFFAQLLFSFFFQLHSSKSFSLIFSSTSHQKKESLCLQLNNFHDKQNFEREEEKPSWLEDDTERI